jgi:glucosamine 6-phosphate synthetase-like amidotransferase/phosphosugar isomerase protein
MDEDAAEKGGHETFMLKEIYEQPDALWDTLGDRLNDDGTVDLVDLGMDDAQLARVERIHIVACGTSYHAGLVGRYLIEDWARVPVHIEVASEYRYRTCLAGPGDMVIGITQSGESADTLAAMRVARERGAHVVALTNIVGSQATRDSDGVILTRAGLEISVAATKTHTAQIMALALLAEGSPVVCVATDGHVFDKVVSNIQEVKARGAEVIAVATEGNPDIEQHVDDVLWVPRTPPLLSPITANLPLQLFAYGVARAKGLNVDQPRNLAKTVTVE